MSTGSLSAEVRQQPAPQADLCIVENSSDSDWDAFVSRHTAQPLFHRTPWKQVYSTYGLTQAWLSAVREGQIVGVLPLIRQKSPISGHQLVSLPWFDASGIIADDELVARALIDAALAKATQFGTPLVQIREKSPAEYTPHVRTDKILLRLKLESAPEVLLARLKAKVRNQVRKGEKSGLVFCFGGRENLQEFYDIYSTNMRDLGSPPHSLRFFESVLAAFPDEARISIARLDGQAAGAGFTLRNGNTLEIPWASSLTRYNEHCVNHFLYWNMFREACLAGLDWFSFGRSTIGSGTHHFKKQWGAEEIPLYWSFISSEEKSAREAATPVQEKFGLSQKIWRKLPLSFTRWLGPKLIANIP